jgi:hypothetical protein
LCAIGFKISQNACMGNVYVCTCWFFFLSNYTQITYFSHVFSICMAKCVTLCRNYAEHLHFRPIMRQICGKHTISTLCAFVSQFSRIRSHCYRIVLEVVSHIVSHVVCICLSIRMCVYILSHMCFTYVQHFM